jgi:enamine deaminase RidA (YjgF/YER057c/UK114 family)
MINWLNFNSPFPLGLVLVLFITACQPEQKTSEPKVDLYPYDVEKRLDSLGITISQPGEPVASFVHAVRTGNLVFLAGKGPTRPDGSRVEGKLGVDLNVSAGYEAARLVGIAQLGVLKAEIGDLNKVKRIVKVLGMVNADSSFTSHPEVINGFSDLMIEVFEERGKHARAAVGMSSLPRNIAVEIELIVEVVD